MGIPILTSNQIPIQVFPKATQRNPARYVGVLSALVVLVLVSCGPNPTNIPPPPATQIPKAAPTPQTTEQPTPFILSEPGPYHLGIRRNLTYTDTDRGDREVSIIIIYPAVTPQDSPLYALVSGTPADLSGAPYPLILSASKDAFVFAPTLVSHGFVWIGVSKIDTYMPWNENLIYQPQDIVFALDQAASNPLEGLEGMIDFEHVGAMGYSFDGTNSLTLGGARVDPEFYLEQCTKAPSMEPPLTPMEFDNYCTISKRWNQFAANAGENVTTSDDGLWQPITDPRIRAVMPMGPDGAWLFGKRGLAAVDRPTLIVNATEDEYCDYNREAVYIYEHLGTADKTLISFIGKSHMMIYDKEMVARMAHFAVAFFGYHLQGRDEYAEYFSKDFVNQHADLFWGVYSGE